MGKSKSHANAVNVSNDAIIIELFLANNFLLIGFLSAITPNDAFNPIIQTIDSTALPIITLNN